MDSVKKDTKTPEAAIQVAIRVRPLIKREKKDNLQPCWVVSGNEVFATDEFGGRNQASFMFDHIFDIDTSNEDVYRTIEPLVESAVKGIHSTIFAYGQTSSGKTHSIIGSNLDPGMLPRAINDLFAKIELDKHRKYLIRASYMEIYTEKAYDLLLKNTKELKDLKIREDCYGNISVDTTETIVRTKDELMQLVTEGNRNRQVGETSMNEHSSRSHVIFKIIIESSEISECVDIPVQVSHLYLIDLAGSERVAQTKATGVRLKEGTHINKSLSTLSLVIRQLSENQEFINYRDSKLTRLLSNALGGNSSTLIIANITPASFEDSLSTLQFAKCAKTIKNKPVVNEVLTEAALIKQQKKREIELKLQLDDQKKRNINLEFDKTVKEKKIVELENELRQLRNNFVSVRRSSGSKIPFRRHTMAFEKPLTPIFEIQTETPEVTSNILELDTIEEETTSNKLLVVEDGMNRIRTPDPPESPGILWNLSPVLVDKYKRLYESLENSHMELKEFHGHELMLAVEEERDKRTAEINALRMEIESLRKEIDAKDVSYRNMEKERDDATKQKNEVSVQLAELEISNELYRTRYNNRETELLGKIKDQESLNTKIAKLQSQLTESSENARSIGELKLTITELQQQLKSIEEESKDLKYANNQIKDENSVLKNQISIANNMCKEQLLQMLSLKATCKLTRSSSESALCTIKDREVPPTALTTSITESINRHGSSGDLFDEMRSDIYSLETIISYKTLEDKKHDQFSSIEEINASSPQTKEEILVTLQKVTAENIKLSKQINELNKSNILCQKDSVHSQNNIVEINEKYLNVVKNYEELKKIYEANLNKLEDLNRKYDENMIQFDAKTEELKRVYDEQLEVAANHLENIKQQHDENTLHSQNNFIEINEKYSDMAKNYEELKKIYEANLNKLEDLNRKYDESRMQYDDKTEQLKRVYDEQLEVAANNLENIKQQYYKNSVSLEDMKRLYDENLKKLCDEQKTRIDESVKYEELKKKYDENIDCLKKLNDNILELQKTHDEECRKIQEEVSEKYNDKIKLLLEQHDADIMREKDLYEKLAVKYNSDIAEMEEKMDHSAEKDLLVSRLQTQHDAVSTELHDIKKIREEETEKFNGLNKKYEENIEILNRLNIEKLHDEKLRQNEIAKYEELKMEHDKTIANHNVFLEDMKRLHDENLKKLSDVQKTRIDESLKFEELKKKYDENIDCLDKLNDNILELQKTHDEECRKIQEEASEIYDEKIKLLLEQHDVDIMLEKDQYEELAVKYNAEIAEMEEKMDVMLSNENHNAENDLLVSRLQTQYDAVATELQDIKKIREEETEKFNGLNKKYEENIEILNRLNIEKLDDEKMRQNESAKYEELKMEYDKTIANHNENIHELALLNENFEDLKCQYNEKLDEMKRIVENFDDTQKQNLEKLEYLRTTNETLNMKLNGYENEIQKLTDITADRTRLYEELKIKYEEAVKSLNSFEREEKEDGVNSALSNHYDESDDKYLALVSKYDEMKKCYEEETSKMFLMELEHDKRLQRLKDSHEEELNFQLEEAVRLQAELKLEKSRFEEIRSELKNLQMQEDLGVKRLADVQHNDLELKLQQQEYLMAQAHDEIKYLKMQLLQKGEEYEEQMSQVREENHANIIELKETISGLAINLEEVEEIAKVYKSDKDAKKNLENKLEELKSSNIILKESLEIKSNEIRSIELKLASIIDERKILIFNNEELQANIQESEVVVEELRNNIIKNTELITLQQEELQTLKRVYKSDKDAKKNLENKLEELKSSNIILKESLEIKSNEIRSVELKLASIIDERKILIFNNEELQANIQESEVVVEELRNNIIKNTEVITLQQEELQTLKRVIPNEDSYEKLQLQRIKKDVMQFCATDNFKQMLEEMKLDPETVIKGLQLVINRGFEETDLSPNSAKVEQEKCKTRRHSVEVQQIAHQMELKNQEYNLLQIQIKDLQRYIKNKTDTIDELHDMLITASDTKTSGESKEIEIKRLKDQMCVLQDKAGMLEVLEEELAVLKGSNNSLHQALEGERGKLNELTLELNKKDKEKAIIEELKTALEKEISELKTSTNSDELEEVPTRRVEDVKQLGLEIMKLKEQLRLHTSENIKLQKLEDEITRLNKELSLLKSKSPSSLDMNKQYLLKEENYALKEQLNTQAEEVQRMEMEIKSLKVIQNSDLTVRKNSEVTVLRNKCARLNDLLNDAKKETETIKAEFDPKCKQIVTLKVELMKTRAELAEKINSDNLNVNNLKVLENTIKELSGRLEDVTAVNLQKERHIVELKQTSVELERSFKLISESLEEVTKFGSEKDQRIEQLNKSVIDYQSGLKRVSDSLEESTKIGFQKDQQIEELNKTVVDLESSMKEISESLKEVTQIGIQKEQQIEQLNNNVLHLQKSLNEITGSLNECTKICVQKEQQIEQLNKTVIDLESNLKTKSGGIKEATKDVSQKIQQIDHLNKLMVDLEGRLKQITDMFNEAKRVCLEKEVMIAELNSTIVKKSEEIVQLQNAKTAEGSIAIVQREHLGKIQDDFVNMTTRFNESKTSVLEKEKIIEQLSATIQADKCSIKQLSKELGDIKQNSTKQIEELNAKNISIKALQLEVTTLSHSMKTLSEQLEAINNAGNQSTSSDAESLLKFQVSSTNNFYNYKTETQRTLNLKERLVIKEDVISTISKFNDYKSLMLIVRELTNLVIPHLDEKNSIKSDIILFSSNKIKYLMEKITSLKLNIKKNISKASKQVNVNKNLLLSIKPSEKYKKISNAIATNDDFLNKISAQLTVSVTPVETSSDDFNTRLASNYERIKQLSADVMKQYKQLSDVAVLYDRILKDSDDISRCAALLKLHNGESVEFNNSERQLRDEIKALREKKLALSFQLDNVKCEKRIYTQMDHAELIVVKLERDQLKNELKGTKPPKRKSDESMSFKDRRKSAHDFHRRMDISSVECDNCVLVESDYAREVSKNKELVRRIELLQQNLSDVQADKKDGTPPIKSNRCTCTLRKDRSKEHQDFIKSRRDSLHDSRRLNTSCTNCSTVELNLKEAEEALKTIQTELENRKQAEKLLREEVESKQENIIDLRNTLTVFAQRKCVKCQQKVLPTNFNTEPEMSVKLQRLLDEGEVLKSGLDKKTKQLEQLETELNTEKFHHKALKENAISKEAEILGYLQEIRSLRSQVEDFKKSGKGHQAKYAEYEEMLKNVQMKGCPNCNRLQSALQLSEDQSNGFKLAHKKVVDEIKTLRKEYKDYQDDLMRQKLCVDREIVSAMSKVRELRDVFLDCKDHRDMCRNCAGLTTCVTELIEKFDEVEMDSNRQMNVDWLERCIVLLRSVHSNQKLSPKEAETTSYLIQQLNEELQKNKSTIEANITCIKTTHVSLNTKATYFMTTLSKLTYSAACQDCPKSKATVELTFAVMERLKITMSMWELQKFPKQMDSSMEYQAIRTSQLDKNIVEMLHKIYDLNTKTSINQSDIDKGLRDKCTAYKALCGLRYKKIMQLADVLQKEGYRITNLQADDKDLKVHKEIRASTRPQPLGTFNELCDPKLVKDSTSVALGLSKSKLRQNENYQQDD